MIQSDEQRVRLRATTTFVREYEARVFEGETIEETLATENAIYREEPLDTAFERYVNQPGPANHRTVVELADDDPIETDLEAANGELAELRAQLDKALKQRAYLAAALNYVLNDLHPSYGSTSGPHGGIGGQAITAWCHVNDPYTEEHSEKADAAHLLLREVFYGG